MGELFGILIIGGILIAWIIAGVNFFKGGAALRFFGHIISCVFLVLIYWGIIVYPVLHCMGFLCGFGEFVLFIMLSGATVLIWGIILLIYSNKHFSKQEEPNTGRHELNEEPGPVDEEF
jgi:hypothetical protein